MFDDPDDDTTRVRPTTGGAGAGDFAASSSMLVHTLPEGTRLLDYRVTGLLGEGGFGIVYLAFDEALLRRVAIKEYLPSAMASRASASLTVLVKSPAHQETFALGMKSFVNEARLLARFDHPALVKVHRFWEENGTAYMVMPYYEGPTLKRALAELGHRPDEAELRAWLHPLLDALEVLHAAHCFHRDIAPDNILLTANGPLLLDFGAARRVIGDMTHALTVVLKPGYAPIEQYGDSPSMTQGAWTDIYALAGVVYTALTGHKPAPAVERLMDDPLRPLSEVVAGRYDAVFLRAIDAALALRPADRPQSIAQFRALLDGREPRLPVPPAPEPRPVSAAPPPSGPAVGEPVRVDPTIAAAPATGLATAAPRRRRWMLALAGTAGLLGLAAIGYRVGRAPGVPQGSAPSPVLPAPVALPNPMPAPRPTPTPPSPAASVAAVAAPAPAPDSAIRAAPAGSPPRRPAPKPAAPATESVAPAPLARPATDPLVRARCSDILQKGSLEPLTASETAFLKRECQ
jgi:serine/threonine protein kinase